MSRHRIGIDLGGTKIEGVALGDGGAELARRRVPTPRDDYDATLAAVIDLVRDLEARAAAGHAPGPRKGTIPASPLAPAPVGVGHPGAISPATGLVKNANSTWLNGRALGRDLPERLGREVRFANDANCFALSEAVDGAGAGHRTVFGVIVGTGTGGGIVVEGRVLVGPNAVAGEWGHNPLPWPRPDELPGPPCYCGKHGCIETFLSGPGMARDHASHTGARLDPPAIAAQAKAGDRGAAATLERYVDRMARALAGVIDVLDPDVIVLGGGMSQLDAVYEAVPARWGAYVFSDRVATPLRRAVHGDAGGVRGAAWLWPAD